MNVWVLDSESGITLLYKPYMDLALDEDLISGLLAALNQFTTYEFKQGIESIEMGGLRWSYLEDNESKLLFIAASEKNISSNMLKARLNVIMQTFIEQYVSGDKEKWASIWKGDTELFSPFKNVIDEYYAQWLTAENITTIAEYFDILGVFQQILNLLTNLIEAHFPAEKKEIIYSQIESMFAHYLSNDYVQKEEHNNHLSTLLSLIFEYLISNISLLNELNLFKFLLQLFLLK